MRMVLQACSMSAALLFIFSNCAGQQKDSSRVFTFVESMPEYPAGQEALFSYVKMNIDRSISCNGRVYVNFVIDTIGAIRNVKMLKGVGGPCDDEAMRVIKSMPHWKPGMQNGKKVEVYYNLPITFN